MTAREWLTVALFVLSLVIGAAAFLLRRFLQTVDRHQDAIYGEQGLFRQLAHYVKREDHDVANAEMVAHMEKMRIEAMQREGRILDGISRVGDDLKEETRGLRADMSKVHDRIDRLRDAASHTQIGGRRGG